MEVQVYNLKTTQLELWRVSFTISKKLLPSFASHWNLLILYSRLCFWTNVAIWLWILCWIHDELMKQGASRCIINACLMKLECNCLLLSKTNFLHPSFCVWICSWNIEEFVGMFGGFFGLDNVYWDKWPWNPCLYIRSIFRFYNRAIFKRNLLKWLVLSGASPCAASPRILCISVRNCVSGSKILRNWIQEILD